MTDRCKNPLKISKEYGKMEYLIFLCYKENKMKAVITVIGKDRVGIISMVSSECSAHNVNVIEKSSFVFSSAFFAST